MLSFQHVCAACLLLEPLCSVLALFGMGTLKRIRLEGPVLQVRLCLLGGTSCAKRDATPFAFALGTSPCTLQSGWFWRNLCAPVHGVLPAPLEGSPSVAVLPLVLRQFQWYCLR